MVSTYQPEATAAKTLVPTTAIVLYAESGSKSVLCATEHRVNKDSTLSIGTTVSADHLIDKVTKLKSAKKNNVSALLPDNLILDITDRMIWHKGRFVEDMWFRLDGNDDIQRLRVEWPPLLFSVDKSRRNISAFALGTNKRPNPNTRLYHAPLMNLSSNGKLCLGTSILPKEFDYESLSDCEDTLIRSQFTHTNHDFTLRNETSDTDHLEFWKSKACDVGNPQRIKAKELCPTITLGEYLKGLSL